MQVISHPLAMHYGAVLIDKARFYQYRNFYREFRSNCRPQVHLLNLRPKLQNTFTLMDVTTSLNQEKKPAVAKLRP